MQFFWGGGNRVKGISEMGLFVPGGVHAVLGVESNLPQGPEGLWETRGGLGRGPAGGRGRAPGVLERGGSTRWAPRCRMLGRGAPDGLGWVNVSWEKAPELGSL